ncbi:internal virion protein [Ralstonia phage RPSC1]|uniref:Putative internal virion protein B n=1 Tax=Ralstonia phage RPSC1 TaxID=2041351 RepID=A0A2Z2UAN6_9CAUD|nr:internal virion protein [Ralstonia phage RPSC1]ATN92935.1 putative internal virion protein B [Ralstonia phage RPSC1]
MAIVGVLGAVSGQKDQADAIGAQRVQQQKQGVQAIKMMNYKDTELQGQDRDNYDQAVAALTDSNINSLRNRAAVEAAMGETGVEGRSMDAVMRDVEGQKARTDDSIRDNYSRQRRGIQVEGEMNYESTKATLGGFATIRGPSALSDTLGVINGGMQGYAAGSSMAGSMKSPATK